jgi:hypothetical protein
MVGVRFPSWGPHFQTLAVSIIIPNLCIGPPFFRSAIISSGESKMRSNGKVQIVEGWVEGRHDPGRPQTIPGV